MEIDMNELLYMALQASFVYVFLLIVVRPWENVKLEIQAPST